MKKTLLTFGVSAAVAVSALAYAVSTVRGTGAESSLVSNQNTGQAYRAEVPVKATPVEQKPTGGMRKAQGLSEESSNVVEITTDLWKTGEVVDLNQGADPSYDTIKIPAVAGNSHWFTGIENGEYAWLGNPMAKYEFSATLSCYNYVRIIPCIGYLDRETNRITLGYYKTVELNKENNYTYEFKYWVTNMPENVPVVVGFIIDASEYYGDNIYVDNVEVTSTITAAGAEAWTEENTMPGLGLEQFGTENTYVMQCEDGVSTMGIFYNQYENEAVVTGINTTASEVNIPENIFINGQPVKINRINSNLDLSAAPNLTSLYLNNLRYVECDFADSNITDVYVGYVSEFYNNSNTDTYLHVPYFASKRDYNSYGFKRVLVGDEQPSYPESEVADWVIAGENEGEYFGISVVNNQYNIIEIFTDNESVTLPVATPAHSGFYYIRSFGSYNGSELCTYAPNLKSITVPASYTGIYVDWNSNEVTDLYMQGNLPEMYNSALRSDMTVHVADKTYFSDYQYNSNWNTATVVPDGWEFDWLTVNVGRKGEFAQTYIEMTDADWSLGTHVKVTGALNATDLGNIKKLTNLVMLDLSEAQFDELPSSFLQNASNITEVILPESLKQLPNNAFNSCVNLKRVVAPGAEIVGNQAFYKCSALEHFDLSAVRQIGTSAFYNCQKYAPANFSNELTSIGSSAFYNTAIKEVVLPEKLKTIEGSTFQYCQQLSRVVLPSTITSIGSSAFYGCSNLSEINLPEGVTSIAYEAFYSCGSLREITLPSTLESIASGAFTYCVSLNTIKCKAIVPPTAGGTFTTNIDMNHCTLYVAPFAIDAYREANYWANFYIMKPLDEPVKYIYINRPMSFDLLSEDNAVLQENPNITLNYSGSSKVGQLSAKGDGTLSSGVFMMFHSFAARDYYNSYYGNEDYRTTLINNAENMRADNVVQSIAFDKNYWHFISFPYDVKMSEIYTLYDTDFVIRRYNSANRASGEGTSSWENMPEDGVLEAGKGYIIQAANNTVNQNGSTNLAVVRFPSGNTVTKNQVFTSNNVIVPLEEYPAEFAHNRSWNLVGNPYPCYYDIHCLMDDFVTPIVVWRGTSYQAYSPVDDNLILRPFEAFFVQRPLDAEQMVFSVEGRMHYDEANKNNNYSASHAPALASVSSRSVFNFTVEGCEANDRARIVMNPDASMDYEDCDAAKFFAETSQGIEIYVDGNVKYDICERPFETGVAALGIKCAKAGEYTLSLSGRNFEGWTVMLTDNETGQTADLTKASYTFDAAAGTAASRFTITFEAPEVAVEQISASEADTNVKVVNTAGMVVFNGKLSEFKSVAQAGIYVVVADGKTYKIVIK